MIRNYTSLITWARWVLAVICREMMPFRYTWSPLKLTNGDPKGLRRFGSNFIYWNVVIYITFTELPLSSNTLRVLYPSMVNMVTTGSSCGCLICFAFCSEKTLSSFLIRWCLAIRCLIRTLLTCLWNAFLKDLYDPPTTSPLVIVLISPTTCLVLSHSSSLWSSVDFSSVRWRAW